MFVIDLIDYFIDFATKKERNEFCFTAHECVVVDHFLFFFSSFLLLSDSCESSTAALKSIPAPFLATGVPILIASPSASPPTLTTPLAAFCATFDASLPSGPSATRNIVSLTLSGFSWTRSSCSSIFSMVVLSMLAMGLSGL